MTLIQGAGVHCPSPRMVTYSRPSAAKPPRPLKNSRLGPRRGTAPASFARPRGVSDRGDGRRSDSSRRLTCSKRLPRRLKSTARAALWSRLRASTETRSARRTNTAPARVARRRGSSRLAGPDHRLQGGLQILRVGRGCSFRITRSTGKLLHPPVFVGAQQLADDLQILDVVDPAPATIGRSPEMPCAQSADGPPSLRCRGLRMTAAAPGSE